MVCSDHSEEEFTCFLASLKAKLDAGGDIKDDIKLEEVLDDVASDTSDDVKPEIDDVKAGLVEDVTIANYSCEPLGTRKRGGIKEKILLPQKSLKRKPKNEETTKKGRPKKRTKFAAKNVTKDVIRKKK